MSTQKQHPLGPIIKVYQAQPLKWRDLWTTFLPLAILVLLPAGIGLWRSYYGYTRFGIAASQTWGQTWFSLSLILVLPLLVYALIRLWRAHMWVVVHRGGLRIHLPPNKKHLYLWDQLEGITHTAIQNTFLGFPIKTNHILYLFPSNHPPLRLPDRLPNLPQLREQIQEHIYPRLRRDYRALFRTGKPLYFGPVWLSQKGLGDGKRTHTWEKIQSLDISNGMFTIHLSGPKPIRIRAQNIPNIELLIEFLEVVPR